jgi:hypothetical protein
MPANGKDGGRHLHIAAGVRAFLLLLYVMITTCSRP